MIINEILTHPFEDFDRILVKLCDMIVTAVDQDQDAGMVAAAVVDPNNNIVSRIGINQDGHWVHAERYAIEEYQRQFGNIPNGTTIVTTLSPCTSDNMELRSGDSCCSLLEELGIKEVYCGYYDPEQAYGYPKYKLIETTNPKIKELCRQIAQRMFDRDKEDLQENFADGRMEKHGKPSGPSSLLVRIATALAIYKY